MLEKRDHVSLYLTDCIINVKYDFNRAVLKYKLFTRHPNYYKNIFYLFLPSIRISGKSINFGDKKINKSDFYKNRKLFKIEDIDIDKILISEKESYGTKN